MKKNRLYLTENDLCSIVNESVERILKESASSRLYHFLSFEMFEKMVETDCFTPTNFESAWHNGKNTMSFSRTKSFREGWPVIMYSAYDGKGDDWCFIRLTLDGDLFNRKSNFKIGNKRYNFSVKPFDWAYKDMNDGDISSFKDNYHVDSVRNGKEWMMQSNERTDVYSPINWGSKSDPYYACSISDKQGHPYSQAEDRLTTYADKIPNASQYIIRVDVLLLPYNFSKYNYEERVSFYNIAKSSQLSDKIHVYGKMRDLEIGDNEIGDYGILKRVLFNKNGDRRYKDPLPYNSHYNIIKKNF